MNSEKIGRRSILKGLAVVPVSALIRQGPSHMAEILPQSEYNASASATDGAYAPKFFNSRDYATLRTLCQTIIPSDERWGGAIEAGSPEYIDLLTSESEDFQMRLGGGILWLDATCQKRYDNTFAQCSAAQQKEILDLIAYTANREKDPSLESGISFFAILRDLTADGYFTSKIGIDYLGYIGNTFLPEFPGCPPVPGLET